VLCGIRYPHGQITLLEAASAALERAREPGGRGGRPQSNAASSLAAAILHIAPG